MTDIQQKDKVLIYMQKNGFITTKDAVIKLNIMDLQARIRDLKQDGYPIIDAWVTNRRTKSRYKIYGLRQEHINQYIKTYA